MYVIHTCHIPMLYTLILTPCLTVNCDFESQDTCSWTAVAETDSSRFKWETAKSTSTPATGPPGDHTTGRGCYTYKDIIYFGLIMSTV